MKELKAPDIVEQKLLRAFREHHAARRRRWMWIPAAIAACLTLAAAWRLTAPARVSAPIPAPVEKQLAVKEPPSVEASPVVAASTEPKRRRPRHRATPAVSSGMRDVRPAQEFVRIPYAPPMSAYEGGQVIRVNMTGASVRGMGFPVMTDRVQADVLLGDDGIARAIRLVSNSGLNSIR